jgi:DNA-directed RNA polymerase subunit F
VIGREVKGIRNSTLGEVKEILEKRAGEGDLGFEQQMTLDYAKKFAKLSKEKANGLVEDLKKIEKLNDDAAVKIADILPTDDAQVRIILAKERYSLSQEEIGEVLKLVGKYAK